MIESVAEYIQRPLLSITAADLGHEPEVLEKNLLRFFRNASKWDAIVLLDEADIYLERRSANDLRRNSIVSGEQFTRDLRIPTYAGQSSSVPWTTSREFCSLQQTALARLTRPSCPASICRSDTSRWMTRPAC